ncbi:MAG: hypothetical protein MZV49_08160 [Rhodopseudomonas palustris]|nr:hypothetical protein [Rhodopseudomonas palustris]
MPSSNLGNQEVIFGGADRLDELIDSTLKVMEADLFVVQTGCIPGLVGDDVGSVVRRYQKNAACRSWWPRPAAIAAIILPGETVIRAIIDQFVADDKVDKQPGLVNVWSLLPIKTILAR